MLREALLKLQRPAARSIQSAFRNFGTSKKRTMPVCTLFTNRKDSELKDGVEGRIAQVVADSLKKPIERVTVVIIPGVRISRLSSSAPAAQMNISSFEVFDKERNPSYGAPIFKSIQEELDVPKERCVMLYDDLDKNMIAT